MNKVENNDKNIKLVPGYINMIFSRFGVEYQITEKEMENFILAFTHKSYVKKDNIDDTECKVPYQEQDYEKLEFIGDATVDLILAEYLFHKYWKDTNMNEGILTRNRIKLQNDERLGELSLKIGLPRYLLLSKYVEENYNLRESANIAADIFEAFLGAIFITIGYKETYTFLVNVIETYIILDQLLLEDNNYKDKLLQFYQKHKWLVPEYILLETSGPTNNRIFTMGVKSPDRKDIIGIGTGTTKKKATQEASLEALKYFKIN